MGGGKRARARLQEGALGVHRFDKRAEVWSRFDDRLRLRLPESLDSPIGTLPEGFRDRTGLSPTSTFLNGADGEQA